MSLSTPQQGPSSGFIPPPLPPPPHSLFEAKPKLITPKEVGGIAPMGMESVILELKMVLEARMKSLMEKSQAEVSDSNLELSDQSNKMDEAAD